MLLSGYGFKTADIKITDALNILEECSPVLYRMYLKYLTPAC